MINYQVFTKMQAPKLMNKEIYHEFWSITNYPSVVRNVESLPQGDMPISLRSNTGIVYSGKIRYQMVSDEVVSPCLQLARHNSGSSGWDLVLLAWSLSYKRKSSVDDWVLVPNIQTEAITTENKAMVHPNIKIRTAFLNQYLQGNQSMHHKLELNILEYSIVADPWNRFIASCTAAHRQNWAQCLANAHPSTADLKIICNDGVELWAHQLVLSEQNEVFAAELRHNVLIEGRTGVIGLREINSSTMRILLHFFYTGELLVDEWKKPENILEFTWAAGKYMLGDVLNMLDDNLGLVDHGENTVKLMGWANQLNLKKAEDRLLARVKEMVQKADSVPNVMELFGASHLLMPE